MGAEEDTSMGAEEDKSQVECEGPVAKPPPKSLHAECEHKGARVQPMGQSLQLAVTITP